MSESRFEHQARLKNEAYGREKDLNIRAGTQKAIIADLTQKLADAEKLAPLGAMAVEKCAEKRKERIVSLEAELAEVKKDCDAHSKIRQRHLVRTGKMSDHIVKLQVELVEYHDAEKIVADPPHDQECCGCVAILRKRIVELEAELTNITQGGP